MRRRHLVLATALACSGLVVAMVAAGSPPKPGAGYAGETSQDRSIRFRVTQRGDLIRRFRIDRDLVCRRGNRRTALTGRFRQQSMRMRIGRGGRFHAETHVEGRTGSRIRGGTVCVRGAFKRNGRVVQGRYRESVRLRDGSLCRAGLVTFIARAGG
jgi:hypothetical protein